MERAACGTNYVLALRITAHDHAALLGVVLLSSHCHCSQSPLAVPVNNGCEQDLFMESYAGQLGKGKEEKTPTRRSVVGRKSKYS